MANLMPLYIKKMYHKDPHFADTKVVISLYDNGFSSNWDERFADKLKFDGFDKEITNSLADSSYENVTRVALKYADGVTIGSEALDQVSMSLFEEATCLKQTFLPEETQTKVMSEFFDKVIEEEVLI
jgi:starch synthase